MVSYIILNWLEKIVWSNKSIVWGVNVMDYLKRHKKILICIILGLLLIETELYIAAHNNNPKEIKDGVIKIQSGESCVVCIKAVAKDKSKILYSREGPNVKIVNLN